MNTDQHFMSKALQLAKRGLYSTSPNPAVGCVIVNQHQIVGMAYHQRAGCEHAEILALKHAGENTKCATAYVTLEPCCHYGKTPPCTDALIQAGIKKVLIACADPNPQVNGKGIAALRNAGIEVCVGLKEEEARALNEAFFYYIREQQPFVIAKWAMSLDGKTIAHQEDVRDISCTQTQLNAHELRRRVDAIIIGANTAVNDNPQLSVRSSSTKIKRQPIRIVVTSQGNLPLHLNIFKCNEQKTIVATTTKVNSAWAHVLEGQGVRILILPTSKNGQVCVRALLKALAQMQIMQVLVEGGMNLHESFFTENCVNKIQVYLAPVVIGSLPKKKNVSQMKCSRIHRDFQFIANYKETSLV